MIYLRDNTTGMKTKADSLETIEKMNSIIEEYNSCNGTDVRPIVDLYNYTIIEEEEFMAQYSYGKRCL